MKLLKCFALLLLVSRLSATAQEVVIPMQVMTGLQFDVVRFRVAPGAAVKIVFTNTDDMNHNFLIVQPGKREEVVTLASQLGEKGPAREYIPESNLILWSMPVVAPEQVQTLQFKAPSEPGIYPYVCTYPGHGFVMYGAMYVSADTTLPELATDMNIPPHRRQGDIVLEEQEHDHGGHAQHAGAALHPYETVPPYLYRVFIAGASPAAIAVALPQALSYCWDASVCKLRMAWKGGFLDNSDLWKGKGDALAKITGTLFYKDSTACPINRAAAVVSYKGYRLLNRYPEFHYTVDGLHVYELIEASADGKGITRRFRVPGNTKPLRFTAGDDQHAAFTSASGKWKGNVLELTAAEGKAFTITMTIKDDQP